MGKPLEGVEVKTCNQDKCNQPAAYRFTWPGRDEAGICEQHAVKVRAVADAMGLPLQVIPLAMPTPAAPEEKGG